MKETIGNFLLRHLQEAGIQQIFGVPGDYNLELMQQLEDRGTPAWIGNCNELNASYAADGYARIKGLGAVVVTNGVGSLSAINGIAGAFRISRQPDSRWSFDVGTGHVGATLAPGINIKVNNALAFAADFRLGG
jgi:hypothetical protein